MFRIANIADASAIAQLHAQSWRNTYRGMLSNEFLENEVEENRKKVWQERLANPNPSHHLILAELNQQPVGFIYAQGQDDPIFGTLIDNLHVAKTFKGQGIGKKLMQAIAHWVQAQYQEQKFYLWVLEQNIPTRQFYENIGAINYETALHTMPDGQAHAACRYVWNNFDLLEPV